MYDEPAVIFFLTQGSIVYAEVIGHSNAFIPVLHCHSVLVYSHCLLVKVLELTQCVPGVKSRDTCLPSGNSTLEHTTDKLVKREVL